MEKQFNGKQNQSLIYQERREENNLPTLIRLPIRSMVF
jgi:hypothetical protein